MTREQAKERAEVIKAFGEGKLIQWRVDERGPWESNEHSQFLNFESACEFRIAPEKKRVPLTMDDIPPVCWMRHNGGKSGEHLVTWVSESNVRLSVSRLSYRQLMDGWLYSTDRKTWLPCSKEE